MLHKNHLILCALVALISFGCASDSKLDASSKKHIDLADARVRLAANPEDLDSLIWVGRRLGYLGRFDEAIATYAGALLKRPNEPRLLRHRGHRLLSVRKFALAEADLVRASSLLESRGDVVEADGIPNAAGIPTSTLHTNVSYHLGLAYFLQRDWINSATAFTKALNRSTRDDMRVASASWAALSYFRAGLAPEAARILKSVSDARRVIENENYSSLCSLQLGQVTTEDVAASLDEGIGLATAGFGLAAFYQRTGEEAKRIELLTRIVRETPPSAFGHIAAEVDLSHIHSGDLPRGGSIIVAGQLFPIAAPIQTYTAGGYDATRETCWFVPDRVLPSRPSGGCNTPTRLGNRWVTDSIRNARVRREGWSVRDAQAQIDQFVIHFDVCVTSQRCFSVLHDIRGLSVHFMLDVDGTIHQTCDLTARARHAGSANDRSIGIEIAHIGAYSESNNKWRKYYAKRSDGRFDLVIPDSLGPPNGGPFTTSRPGEFFGIINKNDLVQVDYTEAQYRSLIALVDALEIALPRIRRDMPRDTDGAMLARPLSPTELRAYTGLLGHHHVTNRKIDPGPSFDWLRVLRLKE